MRRGTLLFLFVGILALIGIAASGYLLYQHYLPTGSSFCNLSDTVNCDVVNKSPYAEIVGVPVALLGVVNYLGVLLVATLGLVGREPFGARTFRLLFLLYMVFGILFSAYLTSIEAFVLRVYCPICVLSAILTLALAAVACQLRRERA